MNLYRVHTEDGSHDVESDTVTGAVKIVEGHPGQHAVIGVDFWIDDMNKWVRLLGRSRDEPAHDMPPRPTSAALRAMAARMFGKMTGKGPKE